MFWKTFSMVFVLLFVAATMTMGQLALPPNSDLLDKEEKIAKEQKESGFLSASYPNIRLTFNSAASEKPRIACDANFCYVVWQDHRDGNDEIYWCKTDHNGNKIIGDINVSQTANTSETPAISIDYNGNSYIVWHEAEFLYGDIYFCKLDSGGNKTVSNGDISPYLCYNPDVATTPDGKSHIVYERWKIDDHCVYYMKLGPSGDTLCPTVCISTGTFPPWSHDPAICADSIGNTYIVWRDMDPGFHVGLWLSGIYPNCSQWENRRYYTSNDAVHPDIAWGGGYGWAWVIFEQNNRIYNLTGVETVCPISQGSGAFPAVWSDGSNGFATWQSTRDANWEIYLCKFYGCNTLTGDLRITSETHNSEYPDISGRGTNKWCLVWQDDRIGNYEIYFSKNRPCSTISYIPLSSGWQWVSTDVDSIPFGMENIFATCWDDLDIIIGCDGSFCIPYTGCWIPGWSVCEMYAVHMADACTIQVCGTKVPTNKPCPLPAGWNCIAYFPECPLDPCTALVSIWNCLDIVKNDDGQFCIPGVGCWIECMEYNEGYKVHLSTADTLVYPTTCPPCPPTFAKRNSFPGFAKTAHFSYLGNTGESYSIVVNSVELGGKHPEVGDEIGIFTPSGLCVGAGAWQGDILGIAVWQDDDRTEAVDGFQAGGRMIFKLWDKSGIKEIELSASFEKGDGRFGTDAYALVNLKGVSSQLPEQFELAQNYPNPFNPETKISYALPEDCDVKLTIYNIMGQRIKVLFEEHQTAGHKHVYWDGKDDKGKDVASGIYFYKLDAGEFTQSKRMVLIK